MEIIGQNLIIFYRFGLEIREEKSIIFYRFSTPYFLSLRKSTPHTSAINVPLTESFLTRICDRDKALCLYLYCTITVVCSYNK